MAYTFEDFQKAMQSSNLTGNFSDADMRLAQSNPNAGMSILQYKMDYQNATTDEMRALANAGAEGVRSSYGGYKGGGDGGSFYLDPLSPGSFTAGTAPTYTNNYADTISDLFDKQVNYGSFDYGLPAPEYANRYDDTIQDLMNTLINRETFSYDPANDQLYGQYRKEYAREGQRATADTLGAAAAASGGIPSSYANTAASQAGDYYAAQMTDKIPELYELAYNQYLNEYNMQLGGLSAVQGAEQSDYDKYLNQMNQYNTDRSFDYSAYLDQYNMQNNNLQTASGLEQLDYTKHLNDMNQYNTDRGFNYTQILDEINSQTAEREAELNKAMLAAQYGDYSGLGGMGINTDNNPTDWERRYNLALLAAEYGDYSGLQALGIDPNAGNLYNFNSTAAGKTGGTQSTNNNRTPAEDTPAEVPDGSPTALSDAAIQALQAQYGGMTMTESQWNALKASNAWLTDEMLTAAGFSKGGAAADGKSIEEYDAAAGNYAGVKGAADQMLASGSGTQAVLNMIKEAWNTGALNTNDYMRLYNKYRG